MQSSTEKYCSTVVLPGLAAQIVYRAHDSMRFRCTRDAARALPPGTRGEGPWVQMRNPDIKFHSLCLSIVEQVGHQRDTQQGQSTHWKRPDVVCLNTAANAFQDGAWRWLVQQSKITQARVALALSLILISGAMGRESKVVLGCVSGLLLLYSPKIAIEPGRGCIRPWRCSGFCRCCLACTVTLTSAL